MANKKIVFVAAVAATPADNILWNAEDVKTFIKKELKVPNFRAQDCALSYWKNNLAARYISKADFAYLLAKGSAIATAGVGKVLIKAGRDWLNSHKKEETKMRKSVTKKSAEKKAGAENLQSAQQYYDSTIGRNPSCRHVEGHGNDQYIAGMQAKVREHFKLKKGEDIPVIYWNANLADGIGLSVKGRPGAIEGSDDERIPGMIQAFRAAPSKQMEEEISDLVRATWHKISGCGAIEVKPSNPLPEAPKVADRGDFVDKEGIKLQMSCDDEALPKVRIGDVVSFIDLAKEPMVLGILVHDSSDHWAGVLRGHKIYRVKDTAKVLTITDFKTCYPVTGPAAIAVVELAHSDLLSAHDNPGSKKEAIEELYEEINEKEIKENGLD